MLTFLIIILIVVGLCIAFPKVAIVIGEFFGNILECIADIVSSIGND